MPHTLDATTVRTWCGLALDALGRAREGIDAINVYPVADGDTGTNLYLTLESAAQAVEAVFDAHAAVADERGPALPDAIRAMAHGALIGARGNSGTILAQLLRGMAEVLAPTEPAAPDASEHAPAALRPPAAASGTGVTGAEALRRGLRRAAESAYEAVAHPVEGTILTVAVAAADAAEGAAGAGAGTGDVARAAYEGACAALDETPAQLGVLGRAGVVDAGGCGLVAVLGALAEAVSGGTAMGPIGAMPTPHTHAAAPAGVLPGPESPSGSEEPGAGAGRSAGAAPSGEGRRGPHTDPRQAAGPGAERADAGEATPHGPDRPLFVAGSGGAAPCHPVEGPAYEVIYLLEATDEAVHVLRRRLDGLGDSLVVVGGDGLWNVHVHVDDAGAAVEAGVDAGRPYRIRITHFGAAAAAEGAPTAPRPEGEPEGRAVVAVVPGEGLAGLYREAGATVVTAHPGELPASGELVEAIRRAHAREVVLLPNDAALRHTAAAAAEQARAEGVRVALIPTRSSVQGIAALAVHEPDRRFDEDVVAMTSAAGATRYAELAVAERQSWTTAGVCEAGDALGLIDGDVAVIGPDLTGTAVTVLDRMLAAGGEMVTLVLGSGIPDDLAERLQAHVREAHLAVDTVVYQGGQPSVPLLIGVE
ncbi:DAK2 domain-containing protein [Streptomyces pathocidini]|uniref:DAK2 domain-containing protein n=3 Tax=Streptomyces pathocidini TaxID=1650571 RepID=A0ABW7US80_9ACTN